ncbi:TadE/TadG family type IV pilus assembly protein [Litchfieldia salsa]|uniref:TadE-like protein n=1 Tax=Litchfieldia salsa TaxID=930152 RepID=A0A1H0UCP6_9BACI|nr:TadE family protein [Litchfieldia salsa]SDP63785.1 TadE-like protein [Litchfieldia salsa]
MKKQSGQSLVEFALVLPMLLFLLFGIVDFGRVFHAYLTVDHAGREAARAASIGSADVVDVAVANGASINLTASQVAYTTSGGEAQIIITYPMTFITPVIGSLFSPYNLTNTTIMRIE